MTPCEKAFGRLSVCMVNYNGERYLEESLGSVFVLRGKFEEILLIDDASHDKSIEIVKDRFPSVRIIQLDKNRGPAAARNVAFRTASCDRILFIDNDVSLTPECPDLLMQALDDNSQAVAAMPCVIHESNRNMVQYDGADSHYIGLMMLHNQNLPTERLAHETRKLSSLVTACFIVDRRKLGNVSFFDESFFIYLEDHDFGLRMCTLGHEILAVPSANAYHREGTKGLSLRESGRYSKRRVFCLIRNRWLILLRVYESKTLVLLLPILLLYEIFQLAGVIKKGWFAEWFKALLWMLFHSVEILQKRRIVQRSRRIPDRRILKDGPIPFTQNLAEDSLERTGMNFLECLVAFYWSSIERYI